MRIKWLGHACFALTAADGRTVVTDPFDQSVGYPLPQVHADIVTISHAHHDHNHMGLMTGARRVVDRAGAFDLGGIAITGIPTFHDDRQGALRGDNLIFVIEMDGVRVAHLGDLGHVPDGDVIERMGAVDVLMIPVGGHYTIDWEAATQVVELVRPGVTIPMHYKTEWVNIAIATEQPFVRRMGGTYLGSDHIDISRDAPGDLPPVAVLSHPGA